MESVAFSESEVMKRISFVAEAGNASFDAALFGRGIVGVDFLRDVVAVVVNSEWFGGLGEEEEGAGNDGSAGDSSSQSGRRQRGRRI